MCLWLSVFVFLTILESSATAVICPANCICFQDTEVTCENGNLQQIPSALPSTIQSLRIVANNITELTAEQFKNYPHLKFLSLENTNVMKIAPYTFRSLKQLQQLYIQRNPITTIESNAFSNMTNIKKLYLTDNGIKIIQRYAFAHSRYIKELHLEKNLVETIESFAFRDLFDVQFLYLPNGMAKIYEDAFHGLHKVHVMEMRGWQTTAVNSYTFRGLRYVKNLKIVDSHLGTIKSYAFSGAQTVEFIQIWNSEIRRLRKKSFSGIQYAGHLDIRNCSIAMWDKGTFSDLNNNGDVFALTLSQNMVNCVCHNLWFVDQLSLPNIVLQQNECNLPRSLQGKTLAAITATHLYNCSSKSTDEQNEETESLKTNSALYHSSLLCLFLVLFILPYMLI